MVQEIIKAVCAAIYNEFGDGYTIYTEAVAQDAAVPCFFVICTQPKLNRYMDNKYYQEIPIVVQYLPTDSENYRSECEDVFERLSLSLDTISLDDSCVHGADTRGEIIDGVLNFFVNYDMMVYKNTEPKARMEKIDITQDLKG